jgi:hypothetical protein
MKFFHNLLNKHSTSDAFSKIQGYDDLKEIVSRDLDAEDNYNLLLNRLLFQRSTDFLVR